MEKEVVYTDPQSPAQQDYMNDCTDVLDVFLNPDDFIDRAGC